MRDLVDGGVSGEGRTMVVPSLTGLSALHKSETLVFWGTYDEYVAGVDDLHVALETARVEMYQEQMRQ